MLTERIQQIEQRKLKRQNDIQQTTPQVSKVLKAVPLYVKMEKEDEQKMNEKRKQAIEEIQKFKEKYKPMKQEEIEVHRKEYQLKKQEIAEHIKKTREDKLV